MSSSDAPTPAPTSDTSEQHLPVLGRPLEVRVDERGVKRRRHYEKPSVKGKRKLREAERRRKRRQRKGPGGRER
jgi:small subunit ribosomal protein S21